MKKILYFNNFNEGVKIAARAWQGGTGTHYYKGKNRQLQKEALLHLFRDFIGKNMSFKMKTNPGQKVPLNYVLLEVTGEDKKNYSGESTDYLQTFNFYFWAEEGLKDDAPFAENKQEVILQYDFKNDKFNMADGNTSPMMNRKLANFLVKSANKLREMVITADMPRKEIGLTIGGNFTPKPVDPKADNYRHGPGRTIEYDVDTERYEELKKSKLKWSDFRCFDDNEGEFRIR